MRGPLPPPGLLSTSSIDLNLSQEAPFCLHVFLAARLGQVR